VPDRSGFGAAALRRVVAAFERVAADLPPLARGAVFFAPPAVAVLPPVRDVVARLAVERVVPALLAAFRVVPAALPRPVAPALLRVVAAAARPRGALAGLALAVLAPTGLARAVLVLAVRAVVDLVPAFRAVPLRPVAPAVDLARPAVPERVALPAAAVRLAARRGAVPAALRFAVPAAARVVLPAAALRPVVSRDPRAAVRRVAVRRRGFFSSVGSVAPVACSVPASGICSVSSLMR
jgi:hypothetical protein